MDVHDAEREQCRHHPSLRAGHLHSLHHEEWQHDNYQISENVDCAYSNLHGKLIDAGLRAESSVWSQYPWTRKATLERKSEDRCDHPHSGNTKYAITSQQYWSCGFDRHDQEGDRCFSACQSDDEENVGCIESLIQCEYWRMETVSERAYLAHCRQFLVRYILCMSSQASIG